MKLKYRLMLMAGTMGLLFTGSLFSQDTDNRIETSAKKTYVFMTYLKGDDIQVRSRSGVVTLTGTVSEDSHLALAADTVADLPGVKSVDNRLTVRGEIHEKNSDAWIHAKVNMMLRLHGNFDGENINVGVNAGRVTLRGEAGSQPEKELTAEYVRDVEGVKDVDNQMTVAQTRHEHRKSIGEFIDDASIKSQIKMALLFHRGTNVFKTDISVDKGVVTVTGTARNAAEIELVTKRIEDIHGVRSVHNRMIIG